MRFHFIFCVALSSLNFLLVVGCSAEHPTESQQAKSAEAVETANADSAPSADKLGGPKGGSKKPTFAPLGAPNKPKPKKPTSALLGGPDKPKFALKMKTPMSGGVGGNAPDRAAEVKRLIDAYHDQAIQYADGLVLATTPEEKEALANRAPSVRALRPIVTLLVHLVAADPKDEPALEALGFLSKYVGVPEIDAALAGESGDGSPTKDEPAKVDPLALLLEHHADNPKVINAFRRLPRGDATDTFLHALFDKTFSPDVRWSAGAQLIASLRRNDRSQEMEPIVITMSEDRYLEGVPVGASNARTWAVNKLREIRTLGIGMVLPEVSGENLEGSIGQISDYRGKVVVLDIWTTWCGPCVKMIPHEVEMAERLKDKPFAILSVSCDKDQETLEAFLEETEMPWDHWWVSSDSEFKKTLNISSFPTVYVLDANGVIRHKNIKDEQLEAAVDDLLAEMGESVESEKGVESDESLESAETNEIEESTAETQS